MNGQPSELLGAALEALLTPVMVLAPDSTIVYENRAFRQMLGFDEGQRSPLLNTRLLDAPNVANSRIEGPLKSVLHGQPLDGMVMDFRSVTGTAFTVEVYAGPLSGDNGERLGSWVVCQPLDSPESQQGRLLAAQRVEVAGLGAAGVIHDLNNILTGVGGLLHMLRAGAHVGPDLLRSLTALVRRSQDITRQLVELSSPITGKPQSLDLRTPVRQAVDLLRHRFEPRVTVQVSLPEQGMPLLGHRTELVQCLYNLGVNSEHAMGGQGTVRLQLERVRDPRRCSEMAWDGAEFARITVSDQGPGIATDIAEQMFRPFFSTKGEKGNGMGLAIVQRAVLNHGGAVSLRNPGEAGAVFEIDLPLSIVEAVDDSPSELSDADSLLGPLPKDALRGRRILVADDEPTIGVMLQGALRARGAEVQSVGDGRAALAALRRAHRRDKPFDTLLVDYQMPIMGGLETIEQAGEELPDLLVIVTSGLDISAMLAQQLAGNARFLPKPFGIGEVLEALKQP